MSEVEKTVFISYRRTNVPWALAIFKHLTSLGYDVFFDYTSIASGDFEQIILTNIKARAHFLVLLTPSALERCNEPGDWLRREIECALECKRNIVPLMLEGFDFSTPAISNYLTGNLSSLTRYNALRVPADYFDAAMQRLQQDFLNISLDAILHPVSTQVAQVVRQQQTDAGQANFVSDKELTAQEWFERGNSRIVNGDWDGALADYNETIRLDPNFAPAYYNRAIVYHAKGDHESRNADFDKGVKLGGMDLGKYFWRKLLTAPGGRELSSQEWFKWGKASRDLSDFDTAIHCYNQAIRLDPDYAEPYVERGYAYFAKGDLSQAYENANQAIRLAPNLAVAYTNRGTIRAMSGDVNGAIADFSQAIRFAPTVAMHYRNRAYAFITNGNNKEALDDFQKYLDRGGGIQNEDQKEVEEIIRDLRSKTKRKGFFNR